MDLVRWNPWREMTELQNRINRFFEDDLFPALKPEEGLPLSQWRPAVDIFETDDHIVIKAELPGVDSKDVDVEVKDRVLTLKGERSYENEVKEENYYRKERVFGRFHRAFTLPVDVNPDKIKAQFKNGVLKIEIPKPEETKPKKISVH